MNTYKVYIKDHEPGWKVVEADDYFVDNTGSLVFRGGQDYKTLRTFAAGIWYEVELVNNDA